MTTDTTPLQERIARAIHKDELDGEWAELLDVYRLEYLATAAAVLPIVAGEVQAAVEEYKSRQVQIHLDPAPPQMVPVRAHCPRCGHR